MNVGRLEASQISVITPTKGRHKQLAKLLETLAQQTSKVGQILIADGGGDADEVVAGFDSELPVQWLNCPDSGQIPQRNHARSHLRDDCRVVIYFDDDIQLEPGAIETLLMFWNSRKKEPGGVSFNITNMPKQPDSFFRHLFLMATEPKGRIWSSGYNSPASGIEADIQSDWLIGGATAWRRDVLTDYEQTSLPSVWAICEDLIFSYPVSKNEPLHVCATARVAHVDDIRILGFSDCIRRGRSTVLWRYYFVTQNQSLSRMAFFWMNIGLLLGRIARGLKGDKTEFGHFLGTLRGLGVCLLVTLMSGDIANELR